MITLTGKGVYGGIAIGRISFFHRRDLPIRRRSVSDTESELKRFEHAKEQAAAELRELYEKAKRDIGESEAQIFDIHRMMLEDRDYTERIIRTIRTEKVNAEYAVSAASDHFSGIFSAMDDPYMQARAADIKDISSRLIRAMGEGQHASASSEKNEKRIVFAADLAPSETMQLAQDKVYAFVTAEGSVNSHTAILARTMGIPAVVNVGNDLFGVKDGEIAIVDGFSGHVYLDPDDATLRQMQQRLSEESEIQARLQQYKGLENMTKDGTKIEIFANIQGLREVDAALRNDAGGIGLFRSEFLYLERSDFPSEEEQFRIYKTVLQRMGEKKVIIRTLDIGADKQADYFEPTKEENPALGMRAIRICLSRPEIFRTQLRALLRASVFGNLSVMFPMITSVWEIREVMRHIAAVKAELKQENLPFSPHTEFGIMIETPAAALISDRLAPLVDFFSIGTNDLTQYTLALDRQNRNTEAFFDPHHEAVLRLIAMTAEQAHRHGKWIGICGELASDPSLTEHFLRMGIHELSVSPAYILRLRDKIRNTDLRTSEDRYFSEQKN